MRGRILGFLLDRRIPQIFGIYLGISWGIIEFVDWIANRYMLSPHLVEFSITILASLAPTILMVAYFHGKAGVNRWTKVEKIGIPTNLVLAAALLILIFQGRDLGAITERIAVENEEGSKIEQLVPKSEFRKRLVLFNFDSKSGDSDFDWLQYGLPLFLEIDLSQDLFFTTKGVLDNSLYRKMKDAGFGEGVGLPFALERKIAGDFHMTYFLTGSFTERDDQLLVNTYLYKTESGKLVAEGTFSGNNVFNLIDIMAVQLKRDLEIPDRHIEKTEDLPISEVTTESIDAFRLATLGVKAMFFQIDIETARKYMEQSVQEDPTFAVAHFALGMCYALLNQVKKGVESFETALRYDYKLPGNFEFVVKDFLYQLTGEAEKRFSLQKMMVQLYPDDIEAREGLAQAYRAMEKQDEALAEYKQILELASEPYSYYDDIGDIYLRKGEFDESLKYYKRYADEFPEEPLSFRKMAGIYTTMGEYQQAKSYYEKAEIIEPGDVSALSGLGEIEKRLGNFHQALAYYEQVLAKSKWEGYARLEDYYAYRGQMGRSIEYWELKWSEIEEQEAPINVLLSKCLDIYEYAKAGKSDVAFQTLKDIESLLEPPFDKLASLGRARVYLELEDADNAGKYIEVFEQIEQELGHIFWGLRSFKHWTRGKFLELKGEYEEAIQSYKEYSDLNPTDMTVNLGIGKCYRNLSKLRKAKGHLQKALKFFPSLPEAHYEIGLVYWQMGKKDKAMEHLRSALDVWKDADAEYKPAKKARETLAQWSS